MARVHIWLSACCLVCLFTAGAADAQSVSLKDSLMRKAEQLHQGARTMADLAQAAELWEQVLSICEKEGDHVGLAIAANNSGDIYRRLYRYSNAVQSYEKALKVLKRLQDRTHEGQTLNNIAYVYQEWGRSELAEKYSKEALSIAKSAGDRLGEANALSILGLLFAERNDLAKTKEYLDEALKLHGVLGNKRAVRVVLSELAILHHKNGHDLEALEYEEKALKIAQSDRDIQGQLESLKRLTVFYDEAGEFDKAIEAGRNSVEIATRIRDPELELEALSNLGTAYHKAGMSVQARYNYERALELARELKDSKREAVSLNNLANLDSYLGNYAEALRYLNRVNGIARFLNDRDLRANALSNQAVAYYKIGNFVTALESNELSLELRKRQNDRVGQIKALMRKAKIYSLQGDYLSVKKTLDEAGRLPMEGERAMLELKQLEADLAVDRLQLLGPNDNAIEQLEPLIREEGSWQTLGRFHLFKSEYAAAKECYMNQLAQEDQVESADVRFLCHTGLGLSFEGLGHFDSAAEHFRKAVALVEEIRSSLNPDERNEFFTFRVGGFSRTDPFKGLARALMKMNRTQEALTVSEYTKARNLSEALSRKSEGVTLAIPTDVLNADESLHNRLAALKRARQRVDQAKKARVRSLDHQIDELKVAIRSHVKLLRDEFPLFAATKYPEPMDLADSGLRDNEWLLEYDVTDTGVLIYLTKGRKLVKGLFKPIPRKELDELVTSFMRPLDVETEKELETKLQQFDLPSGKKLSDILLSDILSDLPQGQAAIVVPDDCLGVLPFEMLVLNDGGKVVRDKTKPYPHITVSNVQFFGDRNPISYQQSITALTLNRIYAREKQQGHKIYVVADPVFDCSDERVSGNCQQGSQSKVAAEAQGLHSTIMSFMRGGAARLMTTGKLAANLKQLYPATAEVSTGMDATKSNFLDKIAPDLMSFDKLVFATHGYFGKNLPGIMEPVLIFTLVPPGTDGYLRLSEVMSLKMNADIVALTACQTGIGEKVSGEGTMSMGRAFQYAGARSVLMTLWSVSEKSSVDLVQSFFNHRNQGKGKLEALQMARAGIRKAGYDHPFFWAPFVLMGESD